MKYRLLFLSLSVFSVSASAAEEDLLTSFRASQRPANATREAEIGLVVGAGPAYLGAQKNVLQAGLYFEVNFGNGAFFGQDGLGYRTQNYGAFSFAGSLGVSRSRTEQSGSADSPNRLSGMGDVPPKAQANLFANYDAGPYHAYAWLQQELGDRNGIDLEMAGLYDLISTRQDLAQLYAGFDYANQTMMQTFFGVTAAQATSSGNPTYTPGAGVAGSAVGISWRHAFNRDWTGLLDLSETTLMGAAADSPLTARVTSGAVMVGGGYRF
jgi:outer membrane protein